MYPRLEERCRSRNTLQTDEEAFCVRHKWRIVMYPCGLRKIMRTPLTLPPPCQCGTFCSDKACCSLLALFLLYHELALDGQTAKKLPIVGVLLTRSGKGSMVRAGNWSH